MVQEDKNNMPVVSTSTLPSENTMNAKAVSVPAKLPKATKRVIPLTSTRIKQDEYPLIATELRKRHLNVTPTNAALIGSEVIGRKLLPAEINKNRMAKLSTLIRDMDASDTAHAKAKITGTLAGIKGGETADILIKAIVTAAVEAATYKTLEGTRKLLLAQEARFQQRFAQQGRVLHALCAEWGIALPETEEFAALPSVEFDGRIVRAPKILIYGIQANQKQPLIDKVRLWGMKDVADIDFGYSSGSVTSMKNGYDVVIINRHFVNIDAVRDLNSHGLKVVTVSGSVSQVELQLKAELTDLAIQAKQREAK